MRKRKRNDIGNGKEPREPTRISPRKCRLQTLQSSNEETTSEDRKEEPRTPHKVCRETRKRSKGSSPVQTTNKGYTSDGMSFESLPDDDTLPDINLTSPYKGKRHAKDDIVWAPYKKIHWPALVTSVKWPHVCFVFVNGGNKPVYKTHAKRLIPFENTLKNLELKGRGENAYLDFMEAYELVVKYLCKRTNSSINARRFLTLSDKNDKVGQAKHSLFRLTGDNDILPLVEYSDEDKDDDVHAIGIDEEEEDENNDVSYGDDGKMCVRSAEDKAKVREILKDLETVPTNMTVTSKQCKEIKREAEQLLEIIQSKECCDHLKKIRSGSIPSSRHMKYYNAQVVHGGLGPFTLFQELTSQLFTALDDHCDDLCEAPDYKHKVMLPEAIIYAITKLKNCPKLDAKKHFNTMCKKVGIRD